MKFDDKNCPFFSEPAATYHARAGEFLSSHQLIDFSRSPLLYYKKVRATRAKEPENAAFTVGEAAHCAVLERDAFDERYTSTDLAPVNPKTGERYGATSKAYQEWAAAQSKIVLSPSQTVLVNSLRDSVLANEVARDLLACGRPEQVYRGEYCGYDCQIRIDWLDLERGVVVDYKTCDRLDFFPSDARKYGYFEQLAFYQALVEVAIGEVLPVKIIATEKQEPLATGVFTLDPDGLRRARDVNEANIERLKKAWETLRFPSGYEEERWLTYD